MERKWVRGFVVDMVFVAFMVERRRGESKRDRGFCRGYRLVIL